MSATASSRSHDFRTVRGRGYRPAQVEQRIAALTAERDAVRERAGRLADLAGRLEVRLDALRRHADTLGPADFGVLGERAEAMLGLAEEEARDVRDRAVDAADGTRDGAGRSDRKSVV